MYLLAPFILQNFKKVPELWRCAIFGPKIAHLSWTKNFWYKPLLLLSSTYWPFSLCKILKNSYSRSRVMRMRHFWAQNGPFPQMIIFSENLLTSLVSIIHAYLHAKNQSQILIYLLMKYWRLKNTEISLAKSVFDYNLRTRFFPSMQFSQNVSEP